MGVLDYRKAVKRGEQRKAIQIVRNALKLGIDIKLISAFTEMTEEEIEIIQIAFNDDGERIWQFIKTYYFFWQFSRISVI